MKKILYTLLLVCTLSPTADSIAMDGESCAIAMGYAIRSLGSKIGTVSAKTSGTPGDNDFRADVSVNVTFLFLDFSLKSSETASIRGGKLVRYHKTIDSKGHRREVDGKSNGGVFSMVMRDGNKSEQKAFPVTGYVTTNMEYPEVTLAAGEIRRIRVLDLENSEIVDREYRHISEEQVEINGQIIRVIVTDFADENAEGRRWTAIISGLPIVVRQEGKEKTGLFNPSYTVRRTKIAVDD